VQQLRSLLVLELYHTANSVCAQKVRIQLEEKGLPWVNRLMTLRGDQFDPAYLKLNPNAVVPTLVHDGFPVIESSVILYYLEECFPEPSLMPAAPKARMTVRLFNKLIDESVHNACTILTFATALRPRFLRMELGTRERYLQARRVSNGPNTSVTSSSADSIRNMSATPSGFRSSSSRRSNARWRATAISPGLSFRSPISR
jgi:hypothetical protein